jgi:hypothetical protein
MFVGRLALLLLIAPIADNLMRTASLVVKRAMAGS